MSLLRAHRHSRPAQKKAPRDPSQRALRGMVDRALLDLAQVVSARGMCAREAARLAHLPRWDLDAVGAACQCPDCLRRRLH